MAQFNPQVPQSNPEDFLRYSHGTSTIPVDKSTGIMLETAGNAITGATSLADQIVKQTIDSDIHKQVDEQQSQFTQGLEQTAKGLGIPTASSNTDILPADQPQGQNVPAGVTNGLSRIQSLSNGIANGTGGKINDTLYSANITSIAKQLRAQYPGYRDYIDQEISKASGMPIANAYYKNLMQDINSGLVNQKALMEKPINQLASAASSGVHIGNVYASDVYNAVLTGKITAMAGMQWLNQVQSINFDFKQREAARNDFKGGREMLSITSADDANKEAAATASATFNAIKLTSGQTIGQVIDSARRGTLQLSDADAQKTGQVIQAQEDAYKQQLWTKWNQSGLVTQLGGAEKAKAIIQQNADMTFGAAKNAIYAKDGGLATFHLEQNAAMNADFKNGLLADKDVGAAALNMKALTDQMGPNWAQTAVGTTLLQSNTDTKFKTYLERKVAAAATGNASDIRFPPSFSGDIADAQGKQIPPQSGYYRSLAGVVNGITDPKVDINTKQKIANYFFAPSNLGVLEKLQRDSGSGRGQIVGADSAFMNMTSPAVTREMEKIRQVNPELFQQYRAWAQDSFNTLTRDDITTLAEFETRGVKVRFNPETHQFAVTENNIQPRSIAPYTTGPLDNAINRLNLRLLNLAKVEEASGSGDINEFLLQTLSENGFRGGNSGRVPDEMYNQIKNAAVKKLTPGQRINQGFQR
jgi:hypothetical protein